MSIDACHVVVGSFRCYVVGLPASSLVVPYMKNDTRRAAFPSASSRETNDY